jgi:hypothetical protein
MAPKLVQTSLPLVPLYSPPMMITRPSGKTAEALYCGAYCVPLMTGSEAIAVQGNRVKKQVTNV